MQFHAGRNVGQSKIQIRSRQSGGGSHNKQMSAWSFAIWTNQNFEFKNLLRSSILAKNKFCRLFATVTNTKF